VSWRPWRGARGDEGEQASAPSYQSHGRGSRGSGPWEAGRLPAGFLATTITGEGDRASTRLAWTAVGCALFVALAVVSEVVSGVAANSPVPSWAEEVVPLAWSQPLRVVWWLAVAAAV
jgi:hypothetical protein